MADYLSKRSQILFDQRCFLVDYFAACANNPWSPDNEQGLINMGTAENYLCHDLLTKKFQENGFYEFERNMLCYYEYRGSTRTREIAARFIQRYMKADHELDPENLSMVLGTISALDITAHIIGDPGDVLLTTAPFYARIHQDCYERALVAAYPIPLSSQAGPGETAPFELTVDRVKQAYEKASSEGKNVKGMVIMNPNNPLGIVYSKEQLMPILEFLAENRLYCIVDEIYALSTFNVSKAAKFDSVLSYWKQLPDPSRTICLWGLSKDFGNGGARTAFVYACNPAVNDCVIKLTMFQCVPQLMHRMVEKVLLDTEWIDDVYMPTNLARMRDNYKQMTGCLVKLGIPYVEARAGLFVFADFRKYMKSQTFEQERALFDKIFAAGVYIVPGQTFYCPEPGWFRIVFTVPSQILEAGLSRLSNVLSNLEHHNVIVNHGE